MEGHFLRMGKSQPLKGFGRIDVPAALHGGESGSERGFQIREHAESQGINSKESDRKSVSTDGKAL
jgi:hypothetical protein